MAMDQQRFELLSTIIFKLKFGQGKIPGTWSRANIAAFRNETFLVYNLLIETNYE
jgi:hypothetical protein